MQLTRCSEQTRATLDEFYLKLVQSDDVVSQQMGEAMLALIGRLRALDDSRVVFGLTSHYHLCLLAEDTSQSNWLVKIIAADKRCYYLEYLLPDLIAPWPKAYVKGEAHSEDEAVRMILLAMEKSEGWR